MTSQGPNGIPVWWTHDTHDVRLLQYALECGGVSGATLWKLVTQDSILMAAPADFVVPSKVNGK